MILPQGMEFEMLLGYWKKWKMLDRQLGPQTPVEDYADTHRMKKQQTE
jgi:hypothetical protein